MRNVARRTRRRACAAAAAIALAGMAACNQVIGAEFSGFRGMESAGGAAGANVIGTGGESPGNGGSAAADAALLMGSGGASSSSGSGGQIRVDGAAGAPMIDASVETGDTAADGAERPQEEASVLSDAGPGSSDGPLGRLVINEIHAVDPDWIELYNPGPGPVALDRVGLTQATGTDGPPQLAALLTFPPGATLAAGEFLLVIGKMPSIGGPFPACGGLAPSCYWVSWGVSASGGEAIYLVSVALGLTVFEQIAYPLGPLAPPVGDSYGRYPDGNGSFTATLPTPAYANVR